MTLCNWLRLARARACPVSLPGGEGGDVGAGSTGGHENTCVSATGGDVSG